MKRTWIITLLLVVCLLTTTVGGTIAWFTDTVTSENNKIEAGNLDVALLMYNGSTYEDISNSTNPIFGEGSIAHNSTQTLWEPGKTQIVYLGVKNQGSLDLKYNIALNVVDAGLVGSLEYAVVNGAKSGALNASDWATLKAAAQTGDIAAGTTVAAPNGAIKAGEDAVDYFALAVHMKEEAGNEYQNKSVTIDVTVRATQLASEFDSFDNQYDKDAAWDGKVPTEMPKTLVVDGATQTIHVKDAAAFAYLSTLSEKWADLYTDGQGTEYGNYANGAGADYYYSGRWTVSLEADINLMNHPIEPVSIVIGQATGASTFKGNGHVISNIDTTTGLFADNSRITYDGLILENVKATNGALTGSATTNISNVTVKNATISGVDYVGGLVGYIYGDVTDCKVIDSSVAASGKEAGGLIGFIDSSSGNGKVTKNEVRNVSVYANNRAGGLVAQANVGVKVYNNTVDTATVVAADISKYQPGAVISNAIVPENVYDNTVNNCKVGREVYGLTLIPNGNNSQIIVNDKEGFLNLTKLFNDWTPLFTDGNGNGFMNYTNSDYYYGGNWTVSLEADIDLNNKTIAPVTIKHPVSAGSPAFDGNNHAIKNAKIVTDATTENQAGLFNASSTAFKNLKLDNIHVTGSNVGNSTAGVLSGTCNALVDNITITNSSVTGGKYTGGVVGYGYTDITNCTLTNVTVKGGYKLGGVIGYICANNDGTGDVTGNSLTGCTVDGIGGGVYAGGKDKYIIGQVVGNYNGNGTCNNNTITNMTTSATENIGEIEAGWTVTQ